MINLEDSEPGRVIIDVHASPPEKKTKTKVKKAKKILLHTPDAAVEFSCTITRAKYDTKDAKCNAYCIAFVGYILDDQVPEEIQQEIEKVDIEKAEK